MDNPLLSFDDLPPFSAIRPEHVLPALETVLADARARLDALLEAGDYSWETLVHPIELMDERLSRTWSPVGHLNAVRNSEALREAYNAGLPILTEYWSERGQNRRLYEAVAAVREGEGDRLEPGQLRLLDNALRDFRLAGVDLPEAERTRFKAVRQELSQLTSAYSDAVLDATQAWTLTITDEARLAGLPETARALARQNATEREVEGWLFTLDFPSYFPVLAYAQDRELRREMYQAYVTRASDQGPNAGKFDNAPRMLRILELRHELAHLAGFERYADYSLATKMARSAEDVFAFLHDLAARARPVAERDLAELREFAREEFGATELEPWDLAFYSEKLREARYSISQEDLRPYFPLPAVLDGLFAIVERLYGVRVRAIEDFDSYHRDLRLYELVDASGARRARFFLDPFARAKKRGGAWMDECAVRMRDGDRVQTPVAYLVCNFTPPVGDDPALLTHDEVETLFHEFGHGLHHMLTQIDWPSISGINGVEWDAVELPSQFMENWCWEREALDLFARHYQSGDRLPEALYTRMRAAKNFQSGMQLLRQLEFALFDFRIHHEFVAGEPGFIERLLGEVRSEVAVLKPPPYNRFANSFTHVFAGGYAAGYYSYKWAEVLSSDAFSAFEENGIFDPGTGERFLREVLERGGSRDALEHFVAFRGREPNIDALLRHSGIAA